MVERLVSYIKIGNQEVPIRGNDDILSSEETLALRRVVLAKQGYRIVGNHSAIKVCHWTKQAIRGTGTCYKHKFYGISSWQCIQATVTLDVCSLRCIHCWRDIDYNPKNVKFTDEPKDIVNGFIEEHKKVLMGFYGTDKVHKERLDESMKPKHVALSLTGDACMYPRLPELINEIHKNDMTSFLVTNGTFTSMIKKLIDRQPTQLYITLPAPNEEIYNLVCNPLGPGGWQRILESISLLKYFKRSVIRLTLAKGINFMNPEGYAKIINDNEFSFLELKSAMPIGGAMYRMSFDQMPKHEEIRNFAEEIEKLTNLKIIDEQPESSVVLMSKENNKDRFIKIDPNLI